MNKNRLIACALGVLMLWGGSAQASVRDAKIQGAKLCTQHFQTQERIHGIPNSLLAAISNTESGRWNDSLGMVLPWPWTINAEGKGYYFDSKAEAVRKVKALQATGMKSIDIGCMQVNLKHHPKAFSSVEQAFDPRFNIAYAAGFLRSHYDETRNWNKAIASYHSKTPKYGNKYLARVQKSWSAITGKVRMARAALGSVARRAPSPSYRVISVGEERAEHTVRTTRATSKGYSLAMRNSEAERPAMALRPVDRLSTSVRSTAIAKPQYATRESMLVRSKLSGNELKSNVSPASGGALQGSGGAVSDLGAQAAKAFEKRTKPKFIFVD